MGAIIPLMRASVLPVGLYTQEQRPDRPRGLQEQCAHAAQHIILKMRGSVPRVGNPYTLGLDRLALQVQGRHCKVYLHKRTHGNDKEVVLCIAQYVKRSR